MKVLIAPDKFKGSLSAQEVVDAISKGVMNAFPRAAINSLPLADGGDGTAQILSRALNAKMKSSRVMGPLGAPVNARWGFLGKTALIDMAAASGLALIARTRANPMKTTTYGLGQLIQNAVKSGATKIVMGVGGSATVDGGIGALEALGIKFLDESHRPLKANGASLKKIKSIDVSKFKFRSRKLEIIILSDVTNPPLGRTGAARVFGPQKGANPAMVIELEKGLSNFCSVIKKQTGKDLGKLKYGGAAGGIPMGFVGVLHHLCGIKVSVIQGIDFMLEELKVDRLVKKSDLILTGEGCLDSQTAYGKTISGLCRLARKHRKPVIAYAGLMKLKKGHKRALGLMDAFPIAPKGVTREESFKNATRWLEQTVSQTLRRLMVTK